MTMGFRVPPRDPNIFRLRRRNALPKYKLVQKARPQRLNILGQDRRETLLPLLRFPLELCTSTTRLRTGETVFKKIGGISPFLELPRDS